MRMRRWLLGLAVTVLLTACHSSWNNREGQTFGVAQVNVQREFQYKDYNTMTLKKARQIGIEPLANRDEARHKMRRLNRIEDSPYYKLDPMPHSMPYLAKGAKKLLTTIGKRFQKELKREGYRKHRIIVTSMLRTREDVARLQRVNGNAVKNSAHMYATTFDITYTRFNRLDTEGRPVSNELMANILGYVLGELRDDGLCRVIFERNQHCFHIMSNK